MASPFRKLRGMLTSETPDGARELYVGDPRFDEWEPVREFEDLTTARSWRRHLEDLGVEAVITSDWPLDRHGRGDISLQVPPGSWSDAEEILSGLDLEP
jgi:hypothetical protein